MTTFELSEAARYDYKFDLEAIHAEIDFHEHHRAVAAVVKASVPTALDISEAFGLPQANEDSDGVKIFLTLEDHEEELLLAVNSPVEGAAGGRIYACPRPKCAKAYKNRNGLKYHLQKGGCLRADGLLFPMHAQVIYC